MFQLDGEKEKNTVRKQFSLFVFYIYITDEEIQREGKPQPPLLFYVNAMQSLIG